MSEDTRELLCDMLNWLEASIFYTSKNTMKGRGKIEAYTEVMELCEKEVKRYDREN